MRAHILHKISIWVLAAVLMVAIGNRVEAHLSIFCDLSDDLPVDCIQWEATLNQQCPIYYKLHNPNDNDYKLPDSYCTDADYTLPGTYCKEIHSEIVVAIAVCDFDPAIDNTCGLKCIEPICRTYDALVDDWSIQGPGVSATSLTKLPLITRSRSLEIGVLYLYKFTPTKCGQYKITAVIDDEPSTECGDEPITLVWDIEVKARVPKCFDGNPLCSDDVVGTEAGCATCADGELALLPKPSLRNPTYAVPLPDGGGPRGGSNQCMKRHRIQFFDTCYNGRFVSCPTCQCNIRSLECKPLPYIHRFGFIDGASLEIEESVGHNMTCKLTLADGTVITYPTVPFGENVYEATANPATETSPDGDVLNYSYGEEEDVVTASDGTTTTYCHDLNNPAITTSIHSNIDGSNHTDITYVTSGNGVGRIQSIAVKDNADNILTQADYSYNDNGSLDTATKGNLQVKYVYDKETNAIAVSERSTVNPLNLFSVTEYRYGTLDENGDPLEEATETLPATDEVWVIRKHPSDSSQDQNTVYQYYTAGQDHHRTHLKKITAPTGAVTEYISYAEDGRVDEILTPDGVKTSYLYDEHTSVIIGTSRTVDDTEFANEWNTYYLDGSLDRRWLASHMDARGLFTTYERNDEHQLTSITEDHLDHEPTVVKEYEYYTSDCADGKKGQLKREIIPDAGGLGVHQKTEYRYGYGVQGKWRTSPTATIIDPDSANPKMSIAVYNDLDQLLSASDASNKTVWYRYDSQLRLTLTVYKWENDIVDGTPEVYSENHYDCCNLIWSRDENGNKTYYSYDDMNRVTKTWTDIPGQSEITPLVEYEYDVFGNQSAVITRSDSGSTRVTSYAYDKANRVTRITYPYDTVEGDLLSSEYFQYDTAGRLSAKLIGLVDAQGAITRGQVTAYGYDAWNRLEKVKYNYLGGDPNPHWPLSAPVDISTADVAYAYELPVGYVAPIYVARVGSTLRTSMTDSSGESEYTYDFQGRLKTYKPPIGLDPGYYVEYDYNNVGQKTQVKITNGTATTYSVTYDYLANGWLKNVKYNGDTIAGYSYDEVGNRTRQINGNGTYTDYTYSQTDARYMMSAITHYKIASGAPVPATDPKLANSIVYARDAVGNPLSITDSVGKWQFGYDANNRLTVAVPPNPVPEQPAGGPYEYDWVGNRLNPPANPNPMVYNAADQLMSWPGMHTYTYYPDGSLQYEKNAAGNQVIKSYAYTPDGLLSTAEFNGKTLTNTWDADKNRVGFSVNSVDHTFVYDTTAGIPAVIKEDSVYYIREPNGSLITRVSGSNTSYYHFDQLGSTRLLTDGSGNVTDEYAYDAYGSLLSHNRCAGSVDQPYQYVGRLGYYTCWQEPEFELLQLGVRFYDAKVGRFGQRDDIDSVVGRYVYVADMPLLKTDSTGQMDDVLVDYYKCVGGCVAKAVVPGAEIGLDIIKIKWPQGRPPKDWYKNIEYLKRLKIKICLPKAKWGSVGPKLWRGFKDCAKKATVVLTVADLLHCLWNCIEDHPGIKYPSNIE